MAPAEGMTVNLEREEEYKEELRRSFALVKPISLEAAAIFYPTLWEINPSTKALFKNTDMVKQGEKLMKVLGVAVSSLRNFNALKPVMQRLGRKHISYGVTAEMYPCVIEALLVTLEKGLGEECTAETKAAWQWVMTLIASVCIEAAVEIDPTYADAKTGDDGASADGEKKEDAGQGGGGGEETPEEETPEEAVVDVEVTATTTTTAIEQEGQKKNVETTGEEEGPKGVKTVEEPAVAAEAEANSSATTAVPERSDD